MPPSTGRQLVAGSYQRFEAAVFEILLQSSPCSVVSIGESSAKIINTWLADPRSEFQHQEFQSLDQWKGAEKSSASSQMAFLCLDPISKNQSGSADNVGKNSQLSYLGALCRQYPFGVVIVQQSITSDLRQSFFAFGFSESLHWSGLADQNQQPAAAYLYRLSDYKAAPGWLNSKYWAHPERYDLPPE